MFGKKSFGTTESSTSFGDDGYGGEGGYNTERQENTGGYENGWGSPDGKGGFGPGPKKKKPKGKKAKREKREKQPKGERTPMSRESQLLFKLFLALVILVMLSVAFSTMLSDDGSGVSISGGGSATKTSSDSGSSEYDIGDIENEIDQEFLTVNDWSRPGTALTQVNGIVVHYVANPGSTAMDNRNYFEGLSESHTTKASAHFVIGLDGEIVQCIPLDEVAYCSNSRNYDTISIECCHPDSTGEFTAATYKSLVRLCKWLMKTYKVKSDEVIRHYDVTGKLCPKYYVEHPEEWTAFIEKLK